MNGQPRSGRCDLVLGAQAMDIDDDDQPIQVAVGIITATYKHYKGKMRPAAPVFDKYK